MLNKWIKTRHAKMFRLSNKVVQVYFKDKTEILLCSNSKEIVYTNKEGKRNVYPLSAALESTSDEISKRMQYVKNILSHLLNNNPSKNTKGSARSWTTAWTTNRRFDTKSSERQVAYK